MFVPVVNIRVMGMGVRQCLVFVRVAVRLSRWIVGGVFVLVMFIVDVAVFMLHRLVCVFVFVSLRKVQLDADAHECCRHTKENGESFLEDHQRQYGPDEGGEREVSASPSRP